jgi:16S rRNA G966 N2-methylase RsmD
VQPKLYEARYISTSEDVKNYFQELVHDCNYSRQWYDRAAEGDTSIFDEARTRLSVEDNGDVRYSADDKRKTYGAPYQGSKNRIARRLIDLLPKGNRFVDLFSGGGAMTHAAIESGKYGSQHMNDIDDAGMRLFLDGASGKWNDRKLEPISDEEFAALKEKDRPEAILRSVMAKGQTMARNDGERDRANEQLARVQSLNGLDVSKVKTSVGDYRKVELKKGDVVYCDIPYEKTHQDG